MTRLVAAELRKVWRSRFFLVALAALLGANLFLLWVGTKPALKFLRRRKKTYRGTAEISHHIRRSAVAV